MSEERRGKLVDETVVGAAREVLGKYTRADLTHGNARENATRTTQFFANDTYGSTASPSSGCSGEHSQRVSCPRFNHARYNHERRSNDMAQSEERRVARWTRAIHALPFREGAVLDLGCAFGHTTRLLKRHGYEATGVDASADYIARARRTDPSGVYLQCDAAHVPLSDGSFDGVLFLDVLEHLPDERGAIREVARLLRPGGTLALSVPHRGPLAWLDSLNLYARLVRRTRHGRFPPEIAATGRHRHYSVRDIEALLGDDFTIRRVRRTGLGLAELVHLPILLLFRWLIPLEWAYQRAAFTYYTAYLAEDLAPLGPMGYHLMVVATRRAPNSHLRPSV